MSCTHAGMVDWDHNVEEWYCIRCGDVVEQPDWSPEEIAEVKGDSNAS